MSDLFTYGELTRPEVMEGLLGRVPSSRPAVLHNYRRVLDEETGFFRVIPSEGSRVDGLLYEELSDLELAKLDEYEETGRGLFHRGTAELRSGNLRRSAWIYLAPGKKSPRPGHPGKA